MEYKLTAPCTAADLAPLRAGDTVLLSGVVYTARDVSAEEKNQLRLGPTQFLAKGRSRPEDVEDMVQTMLRHLRPTF